MFLPFSKNAGFLLWIASLLGRLVDILPGSPLLWKRPSLGIPKHLSLPLAIKHRFGGRGVHLSRAGYLRLSLLGI